MLGGEAERVPERFCQFSGGLIAVVGILAQGGEEDLLERPRDVRVERGRRRRRLLEVLHDDGDGRVGVEGDAPGQHLVEDDAEGVEVSARVARLALPLFGGHVGGRARDRARHREARAAEDERDAEVGEHDLPFGVEHDVGRFQVSVDHAARVGVVNGVGERGEEAGGLLGTEAPAFRRALLQFGLERWPLDVLHDHVVPVALGVEVVDLQDVGMAQTGDGVRLALEAANEILVLGHVRVQDFEGDVAVEAGLVRLVDLRHPALAEQRDEVIFSECLTDEVGHEGPGLLDPGDSAHCILNRVERRAPQNKSRAIASQEGYGMIMVIFARLEGYHVHYLCRFHPNALCRSH